LRPYEISGMKSPEFVKGKIERFDVNQGEVGNCWFLSALANLAENRRCFDRVVPSGQSFRKDEKYRGIFRFRFFRFNQWVEVVVDDLLPTRNGKLIYLRSREENEFWSPLLEKAYAKLYGSYQNLDGGLSVEAAVDFTGGIPELIPLSNAVTEEEKKALFKQLVRTMKPSGEGATGFLSSSLSGRGGRGLTARHAYSITNLTEVRLEGRRVKLVRIRNPHGNEEEWNGKWSDEDRDTWSKVSAEERMKLKLKIKNDGEFYMDFDDFLLYFGEVEVVHVKPLSRTSVEGEDKWEVFSFTSRWMGPTAGGCGNDSIDSFLCNPHFFFNLEDPEPEDDKPNCSVIIALAQKPQERRSSSAIGFRVYRVEDGSMESVVKSVRYSQPVAKTDRYINMRELSVRMSAPPGKYVVIASTFRRGEEAEFLLRIFLTRGWGSSAQADRRTAQSYMEHI